jgi:hypothetical protein
MMTKKVLTFFIGFLVCLSVSLAGYSDGFITAGEYEGFVTWTSSNPPLIVEGGGAVSIEVRNSGRLEVRSTSTPVNGNWHTGGITDIGLLGYSHLDYLGGITEEITIASNATANLTGGRIDAITSMQFAATKHIDLYCQPGWSWVGQKVGITGLWENGIAFNIELINDSDYDPTWMNINVVEIPEPVTLTLLGLGGLFLRRTR